MSIKLYVDGSCSKNGKKENFGGYSVILTIDDKNVKIYKEGKINTTNNEMEMLAVLKAIKIGKILTRTNKREVEIFSDSSYVVNTVNEWMKSWASNNWIKKSDKKAPENLEIVKEIYNLMKFEKYIKVKKVTGHSGDEFNELADLMAKKATKEMEQMFLKGGLSKCQK